MRPTLNSRLLLAVIIPLGMAAVCPPAAAQASAEAGMAISTVMFHRMVYLADSTRFDACTVRQAMNGVEEYAAHIIEPVRGMLDDTSAQCPHAREWYPMVVLVDSLRFTDTTAQVYLTVLHGEMIHRENYTLSRNHSFAAYMPFRDVRLWGHGQAYRGPRRPPAAP
jgi:hypothetical protein